MGLTSSQINSVNISIARNKANKAKEKVLELEERVETLEMQVKQLIDPTA